jgi:hypothetical protein
VPTVGSKELTRATLAVQRIACVSRLTNATVAWVMVPGCASKAASSLTALMSLIVAVRVTIADVALAEPAQKKPSPV